MSKKAQGGQGTNSLFDFLYHDRSKVDSILSQLTEDGGVLTEFSHSESYDENNQKNLNAGGKGSLHVVEATGGIDLTLTKGSGEGSNSVFDPVWGNALSLLSLLQENKLYVDDGKNANIGQFVLLKGEMAVTDMELLTKMFTKPGLMDFFTGMNKNEEQPPTKGQRKHRTKQPTSEFEKMGDFLSILPSSVRGTMVTEDMEKYWFTLKESCLITSAAEIMLKYGSSLSGTWHALGILDAQPFDGLEPPVQSGNPVDGVTDAANMLAPIIRQFFGRPLDCYGITPLMVFRKVNNFKKILVLIFTLTLN